MSSKRFAASILGAALFGWLLAVTLPDLGWLSVLTSILQTTYLAALKMIVVPLIFFSLMSGVLKLRQAGSLGRLGSVTLLYYFTTSAIAITIGLVIVFFIHPWTDYPPIGKIAADHVSLISSDEAGFSATIGNLLKALFSNPFAALAELNILGILMAALLFGVAAAMTLPEDSPVPRFIDDTTQVVYRVAGWVISLLPVGLFAIAYQLTQQINYETFVSLAHFALVVIGATLFHGLVVLPLIAWVTTGRNPIAFLSRVFQPMMTAFITSSSAATLPLTIKTAQEQLELNPAKSAFVLPLGATINMDGTALFEGIAVIFLAYMFGVELDGLAIVVVFLVTMLASAGAPGIPSGSMAGLQVVLLAVGIPLEAIALVLLIERPLDTIRTAINVEGDLVGALVVDRWT